MSTTDAAQDGYASCASSARSSNDLSDDGGLRIGVILDALPLVAGQRQFGAFVQIAISGAGAKPIPEHQHALHFPRSRLRRRAG